MVGLVSLAYREESRIVQHVRYWRQFVDEYLLLVSDHPWHGKREPMDQTVKLARKAGATVLVGDWRNEETQRNTGQGYFWNAQRVWHVDPDEYVSPDDIAGLDISPSTYGPSRTITYWKNGYSLQSSDNHIPVMLTTPDVHFIDARCIPGALYRVDITLHHLSFVRTDEEVKRKLTTYAHAGEVRSGWYEDKWLGWSPETTDLHPISEGVFERAVPTKLPGWLC